jgi:hypothetical protein
MVKSVSKYGSSKERFTVSEICLQMWVLQVLQVSKVVVSTAEEEEIAMNVVETEVAATEEVATDVKVVAEEDAVEIIAVEAKKETVNQKNKRIKAR